MPIVPLTQFNNSVVMGAAISAIIFIPIVYFISLFLVEKYRLTVLRRLKSSKFFKTIQATRFYKWYYKYEELYGE